MYKAPLNTHYNCCNDFQIKILTIKLFASFDPIQSILIIGRVRTCKLVYMLKCTCNSKIKTGVVLQSFTERHQAAKNWGGPVRCAPPRLNRGRLCRPASHREQESSSPGVTAPFLCFFLVLSLADTVPKPSAGMLGGVPEGKKAAMCLPEKTWVLGELPSGVSCRATGHEFNGS